MAKGPEVLRLEQALSGAAEAQVQAAIDEWNDGANLLDTVRDALEGAAPTMAHQLGPQAGEAAAQAFTTMAAKVEGRRQQMAEAGLALIKAKTALVAAREVQASFGGDLTEPAPFRPDPTADEMDQIKAHQIHTAQVDSYNAAFAAREEKARVANENLKAAYTDSTQTMKQIHGEPDDPTSTPPQRSAGGVGTGGGAGGGAGAGGTGGAWTGGGGGGRNPGPVTTSDPDPTRDPQSQPQSQPQPVPDSGNDLPPGLPQGPSVPGTTTPGVPGTSPVPVASGGGSNLGGLAGALGGGLLGGAAGIGGSVRGGLTGVPTGSTTSSGARAIGSTTRTGTAGTLGRGATPGAAAGRAAGRAGSPGSAGRTTGSSGAAGGRGKPGARGVAAAGRGTGAGAATGRNGRTKDRDEAVDNEFFEDVQDWVDDEDAAPGVLG